MPQELRPRPPCRHFQLGRCAFPEKECRFLHVESDAAKVEEERRVAEKHGAAEERARRIPAVCRHYVEGYCVYGDKCLFRHDGRGKMSTQDVLDKSRAKLCQRLLQISEQRKGIAA